MTPLVAGLDPSTARTGLVLPNGTIHSLSPPAAMRGGERLDWIEKAFIRTIRTNPPAPRVVVIEKYPPSLGKAGASTMITIGELRGVLRRYIWSIGADELDIEPTRLKRWATGDGRADKNRMVATAVAEGALVRNDDEADAWHLQHLGLVGLGYLPVTGTKQLQDARRDVLASIDWPSL